MRPDIIDVDEADILVFERGLLNADKYTKDICTSLDSIQKSTHTCQMLFEPILSTNQRLTTLSKNIEESLDAIASIKDVATDASKHDLTLSQPIEKIGLSKYVKAIYKIEDLLEGLGENAGKSKNNIGERTLSGQNEFQGMATNLQASVTTAEQNIQHYFLNILNLLQPFDPQILMNKRSPFPYYQDSDLEMLKEIFNFFHGQNKYAEVVELFVQQRCGYISKSMAFCEQFTKALTPSEKQPYEKGSSGVLNYCEALTGFISNELNLLQDLRIQSDETDATINAKSILIKILSPVITSFVKIVNHNMHLVKQDPVGLGNFTFELTGCISKVIKSLSAVSFLQQQMNVLLAENERIALEMLSNFISYISSQSSSISKLPSNLGIAQETIDIMTKMRKLSDYSAEIIWLLKKNNVSLQSWIGSSNQKWFKTYSSLNKQELTNPQDPDVLLSCYYGDCLDVLCVSLESRATTLVSSSSFKTHEYSKTYQSDHNMLNEASAGSVNSSANSDYTMGSDDIQSLVGFFVLSNISLMEQILLSSPVGSIITVISQRQPRMAKLKKRYLEIYLTKWKKLALLVMPLCTTGSTSTQALTTQQQKKQKEQAKELLKSFNAVLDIMRANFKNLRISDRSLKKVLVNEIKSILDPVYRMVWNKYKDSFKNREKYLKYTPEDLSSVLIGLGK